MKKFFICFVVFLVTGLTAAFLGVSGDATFVIGGICVFLYLIFSRKNKNSNRGKKTANLSKASSTRYRSSRSTDYWDQRNIPSHWTKARVCVDGDHDNTTVSRGDASHCYKCGKRFDGVWGDRGLFDGYFCQTHKKWIPRGDYCKRCKDEGFIP